MHRFKCPHRLSSLGESGEVVDVSGGRGVASEGVVVVSGGRGVDGPSIWGIGDWGMGDWGIGDIVTAGRQTVFSSSFPAPLSSSPRERPAIAFRREAIEGGVADRSGSWGVVDRSEGWGVSRGRWVVGSGGWGVVGDSEVV